MNIHGHIGKRQLLIVSSTYCGVIDLEGKSQKEEEEEEIQHFSLCLDYPAV